jgi:hypothetical protein
MLRSFSERAPDFRYHWSDGRCGAGIVEALEFSRLPLELFHQALDALKTFLSVVAFDHKGYGQHIDASRGAAVRF